MFYGFNSKTCVLTTMIKMYTTSAAVRLRVVFTSAVMLGTGSTRVYGPCSR